MYEHNIKKKIDEPCHYHQLEDAIKGVLEVDHHQEWGAHYIEERYEDNAFAGVGDGTCVVEGGM